MRVRLQVLEVCEDENVLKLLHSLPPNLSCSFYDHERTQGLDKKFHHSQLTTTRQYSDNFDHFEPKRDLIVLIKEPVAHILCYLDILCIESNFFQA